MNLYLQLGRLEQDELVGAFWANQIYRRPPEGEKRFGYTSVANPVKRYVAPPGTRNLLSSLVIPTQVTAVDTRRDPVNNSTLPSGTPGTPPPPPNPSQAWTVTVDGEAVDDVTPTAPTNSLFVYTDEVQDTLSSGTGKDYTFTVDNDAGSPDNLGVIALTRLSGDSEFTTSFVSGGTVTPGNSLDLDAAFSGTSVAGEYRATYRLFVTWNSLTYHYDVSIVVTVSSGADPGFDPEWEPDDPGDLF